MMRLAALLILAATLAGCASTGAPVDQGQADALWQSRKPRLQALDGWKLHGRLAVTDGAQVWNASVDWQQWPRGYDIRLHGPLGTGQMRLIGTSGGVVLNTGEPELYYAKDAEALLLEHTGVHMPIEGLHYWIRGLPQPAEGEQGTLDAQGRLQALKDAGWKVDFKDYTQVGDLQLPRRLFIHKGDVEVRVVVDKWMLPEPETLHARREG